MAIAPYQLSFSATDQEGEFNVHTLSYILGLQPWGTVAGIVCLLGMSVSILAVLF